MPSGGFSVRRLTAGDTAAAVETFALMADVFETPAGPLSERYVSGLLDNPAFWALAATKDGQIAGGLTAHTLPMTRSETSELFLYDIAVRVDCQRQGIGRLLVYHLRSIAAAAGIDVIFVPAENEDGHALDFYRALGGKPGAVTIFEL
ncbi:MAG: GNAT family N-acetyltransferase [Acidobacteria bacterium]|nr:GNAT family N-acetyltransferase [Acidobacteriota bacterium]